MIVHVRVSDNVLKEDDWGINELAIVDGHVEAVTTLKLGCYDLSDGPAVGWDLGRLSRWLRYDGTGTHPEIFCEIRLPDGDWQTFCTEADLTRLLGVRP